ncbi:NADH dehydrogenase [ubiquinone] 1 alpha subcomplex assembly factor 2 [Diachasma alloeum]|uniref:NADH dehydrogenase [ubiquinone] 1 alpha subcomplex assembly factor 2 n=1 Tax=Diachasma alloeum TaxID=454923 RepID=UPI0007384C8F|nr:NADH dehydrogenase [ubiquinone] 1 alpha subcomplex assembly factor 2 [Diachasma alloeum]XP_015116295.1 NADH dehydrogenase [ubiquinone] 1 alpha subcomplex assembly factor 2 [Diachasma alloeum]
MPKERGLVVQVLRNFIASFKPRMTAKKLVGEDYNGTKYYEDPEAKARKGRSFVPYNEDDFEQELPAEWDAWLRYRRHEPPSEEEVNKNYQMMMLKKKNAAALEKLYAEEKGVSVEIPKQKTGFESFPTYEEYKRFGQAYLDEKQRKKE